MTPDDDLFDLNAGLEKFMDREVATLTEDDLDTELRALGFDPDTEAAKAKGAVNAALNFASTANRSDPLPSTSSYGDVGGGTICHRCPTRQGE